MSTRCITAVLTESGPMGVYVHSDGYPDGPNGRLSQLATMIGRDTAPNFCATLLKYPWWSFMFHDTDARTSIDIGEDGQIVLGYGVAGINDAPEHWTPANHHEFWDCEYVYLIHPETGAITWAPYRSNYAAMEWQVAVPV